MILTIDELAALTGRTKYSAQCRALDALGITYRKRHDGSPVVLRSTVDAILGAKTVAEPTRPQVKLTRTA